ncbi:MAG: hypothetical protein A2Y25_11755 [Candidatus Melainabacteria bacterium GWF2_37_15]|nr:MAG: hypothetical protein A2Y25_11755 [Candidatus Melainabacteria bacterium GWF2_37_15]
MNILKFFRSPTMRKLDKQVEQEVKRDLPGILNKQAVTKQANLQQKFDELGQNLTSDERDVLNNEISEIMKFHLNNPEVHGLAKKQLQKPEDLARQFAYEDIIQNHRQILKDHAEQQGRDNIKELMKKAGIWKGN